MTAFNLVEVEVERRRSNDFSREGQQRIAAFRSLFRVASNSAACCKHQNGYDVAGKELDGPIVLPTATQTSIERKITGKISNAETVRSASY